MGREDDVVHPDWQKVDAREPLPAVEIEMPGKAEYAEVDRVFKERRIDIDSLMDQQVTFLGKLQFLWVPGHLEWHWLYTLVALGAVYLGAPGSSMAGSDVPVRLGFRESAGTKISLSDDGDDE